MRRSWTIGWLAVAAAAVCAVGMTGCGSFQSSGIDPTGEHVFTPPPSPPANANANANPSNPRYFDEPMNRLPWDDVAVLIEPRETVVPVGSEVVLIAGVAGPDGYLRTNRRLEWSIAPGGVGQFVAIEKNGMGDLLLGDFNWPRIVNSTFAVGSTSRDNVRLNRGACTPENDKFVLRGQGWITITSPIEGTSHVTVVAPEVYSWDARTKSAAVHFVDAVVQYPPPAINPAGTKHVFTTSVTRHSNQSPCENWIVRYEIVGGPPAGFSPADAASIEVRTNSAGQASAEIFQKQPASGVNKICIQVIRPADAPGAGGQRLVISNGTTTKTWSAADLAVRVTGPATANVGETVNYQIELSNPGDLAAKDVTATVDVPDGLTFLGANPAAEVAGHQLRWRLGDLGARQRQPVAVGFRAEKQGSAVSCCEATRAGGLKVRDCATTTIALPGSIPPLSAPPRTSGSPLDVLITPAQTTATVGDKVAIGIAIANRTQTAMTNVRIKVRLDRGLAHDQADDENAIKRELPDLLSAGETRRFGLTVRVTQPGRLYENVEVSSPGVAPVTAQGFITAVGGGAPPPLGAATAPIVVTVTGPPKPLAVGKTAEFAIEVKNVGSAAIQNVKVVDRCDSALDSTFATDGWHIDNGALAWTIDSLPAGGSSRFRIQCTCQTASAMAYHRVTVNLPDGSRVEGSAFVEIFKPSESLRPAVPQPTMPTDKGLSLSALGLFSPVRPGKELTYEIQVMNNGTTPVRQIAVTANVPAGMTPIPLGTVAAKFDGQRVDFDVAPELEPGKSLTYRVRVLAKQAGVYRFHAELTALGLPKPMTVDADETEVRE